MSDEDDKLKIHIHYRGSMSREGNKFSYIGGITAADMVVDPNYLTFSIFEDFTKSQEVETDVEKIWYRLPNEDLSVARCIYMDKDNEIMKMSSEAKECGKVFIYIEHSVSPTVVESASLVNEVGQVNEECLDDGDKADDEEGSEDEEYREEEESDGGNREEEESEESDGGNREKEESDEENREEEGLVDATEADGGVQSEDENEILGEGANDSRFDNLFAHVEEVSPIVGGEATQPNEDAAADYESEIEGERQLPPGEYPDSPEDTDEEWVNWQEKDDHGRRYTGKGKADYDKPPYLWLMQTFNSGEEFKDQLLKYVLKTQYDVKLNKWQGTKHAAICTHAKCKWRIYCSVEKPIRKWMVKVYEDKHNHLPTGRVRMLKQGAIARLFKEEARRRPEIRSSDIKNELMHRYNISVFIFKCRKARRIALDMVLETQKQQFAKLWDYQAELVRSNEGVTTEIRTVEKNGRQVFESFYVSFEPIRRTWKKYCRPLIGVDGAFLKWELKGEILAAVGRDAENRIYPIAWAIVRGENTESWEWFIKKLQIDLELGLGDGFTFISDKQKGLKVALATVLPNAEHRNCAKHVYGNWSKKYRDSDYKPFFWNVAYSKTVGEYDLRMDELSAFDKEAHDDLKATEPQAWSLAFASPNGRSPNVCNNLSESFNRTIKRARELPLINMLETIRRQAMMRIARRFKKAKRCILPFPKKIGAILETNREHSKYASLILSSDNLFEVQLHGCNHEVSLRLRHCACREWDLTGIPCAHAVHVINENHQKPENHVDTYYKTEVWIETYRDNIKAVNGEKFWTKTGKAPIGVPDFRKMPGKPKKKRIKAAHESPSKPNRVTRDGRIITCGNCRKVGHNRSTCKNASFVPPPPRKRGRPRKITDDGESNSHPPRKRKKSLSQPLIPASTPNQSKTSTAPPSCTAPEPARPQSQASTAGLSSSAPLGRGRGRRGRPPGRGQARKKVTVPRGHGVYMCPFTDRVFKCFGSKSREM